MPPSLDSIKSLQAEHGVNLDRLKQATDALSCMQYGSQESPIELADPTGGAEITSVAKPALRAMYEDLERDKLRGAQMEEAKVAMRRSLTSMSSMDSNGTPPVPASGTEGQALGWEEEQPAIRAGAVDAVFKGATVIDKHLVDDLQEDVEAAIKGALRYREKMIAAEAETRAVKEKYTKEMAAMYRGFVEEVNSMAETKFRDLLVQMWVQSSANSEASFMGRQHDLLEKYNGTVAQAKITDHKAIVLQEEQAQLKVHVDSALSQFLFAMNEIDANLTKATEEHASKAQGMESSLEENQRSLEESQRSLEEKQRALEEKERALEDAKRSLDESHLALASMTQACKKADDQILATQQQAAKNFQKTLEEGVIMVKHCRGKKKKHAKVFRWVAAGKRLEWDDGKKRFEVGAGAAIEVAWGMITVVNTDGGSLTMELESATGAKEFAANLRGLLGLN
ncbi:hypothetical protein TeGR_g1604 [Tetraparma gracilis]|uniref:Uncharacterized protein n=1 Tax=Tetraparma gracilis TaxID=2962635 RepID=A0ABQ6M3J6_9STRA|nr:hypothetical protein TeGR_g1604 [Tetraparma gracilis]